MIICIRTDNSFSKSYPSFLAVMEGFSKIIPSFFTVKEGSTSLTNPLSCPKREDVTALRCSESLRYKVGGPSKLSPCCAGWVTFALQNIKIRLWYFTYLFSRLIEGEKDYEKLLPSAVAR